ncbi:hypothetical protein B7463_g10920, partial [Scytalidium lignicola]
MPPQTILSVLSRENPTPKPWHIGPAPNTLNREWQEFEDWKLWNEFNLEKLRAIYKDILDVPWRNAPDKNEMPDLDLTYGDEDGFEHQILSRDTVATVNIALRRVHQLHNHLPLLHLGWRGRSDYEEDNRINPD